MVKKLSVISGSLVSASWTTLTAFFSTSHSPAEDKLTRFALSVGYRMRIGPNFAISCKKIIASPKTDPFLFRRGRIMSPIHLHSLPLSTRIGIVAVGTNAVSLIWWMMTKFRELLLLHHIFSRGRDGAFALPPGQFFIKQNATFAAYFAYFCIF